MKKRYFICGGLILLVVIAVMFIKTEIFLQAQSFDALTEKKSETIAYIKDSKGEVLEKEAFLEKLNKYTYKRYKGNIGSTSHRSFEFYDASDKLLFTLTDVGNRNLLQISKDGKRVTYIAKLSEQ